jgi:hypothetical protein
MGGEENREPAYWALKERNFSCVMHSIVTGVATKIKSVKILTERCVEWELSGKT